MATRKTHEDPVSMVDTFKQFKDTNNIARTTLMSVLEESFRNVIAKIFGSDENFDVIVNPDKGDFEIYRNRIVVADGEVKDENKEIALTDALKIEPDYEVGEEVSEKVDFSKFGRRAILNLRQKNRYLETENQKTAELTRLAERDRISRELHDVIGHTLSSSILQLEALHVTTQDENQKRALAGLRDRLSGGMDDIRKTLHKMRRESFDLEQKVRGLAAEMPDRELDWSMYVTSDLSLNFRLDLLNIIQEGVTNFQKYSEADTLTVRLIEQQTFYSLEIRDPGPAKRTTATEPGIGLFSMRETAERYGGLFRRNDDRGFGVHLTFPKTEATAKE